jgi:hypothetical protein
MVIEKTARSGEGWSGTEKVFVYLYFKALGPKKIAEIVERTEKAVIECNRKLHSKDRI